jgi:glucosyl-3-phosphoglycerate synthase
MPMNFGEVGAELAARKRALAETVAVVVPARNEQDTIAPVLDGIREAFMGPDGLVDELIVMDSLSTDATYDIAVRHGARAARVSEVAVERGVWAGKGEALWKSLFVTSASLLVFIDAYLTEWGPHFVSGLLDPLLNDPGTLLVKGYYDRISDHDASAASPQGGRVTELVARPLLSLYWPQLLAIAQPLAGEWAIRRSHFQRLRIPQNYGVEFTTLVDTWFEHGIDSIAQVDLGRRAHQHQGIHDLGLMAAEIMYLAADRVAEQARTTAVQVELAQPDRGQPSGWLVRCVPTGQREPMGEQGASAGGSTTCFG